MILSREVCFDANVFVSSLIKKEPHYEDSLQAMTVVQKEEMVLFEPEVVLFEFGTAMHRKKKVGDIDDSDRDHLIELFFKLPLLFLWEPSLMQRASFLAQQLSFRGLSDCLYIAVAERKNIPLVTLDEDLMRRGRKFYKKIYSVAEFLNSITF